MRRLWDHAEANARTRRVVAGSSYALGVVRVERQGPPAAAVVQSEAARELTGGSIAAAGEANARKDARRDAQAGLSPARELQPERVRRKATRIPIEIAAVLEADQTTRVNRGETIHQRIAKAELNGGATVAVAQPHLIRTRRQRREPRRHSAGA